MILSRICLAANDAARSETCGLPLRFRRPPRSMFHTRAKRKPLPQLDTPPLGGTVFAILLGLWLTSAYWFFTTVGISL